MSLKENQLIQSKMSRVEQWFAFLHRQKWIFVPGAGGSVWTQQFSFSWILELSECCVKAASPWSSPAAWVTPQLPRITPSSARICFWWRHYGSGEWICCKWILRLSQKSSQKEVPHISCHGNMTLWRLDQSQNKRVKSDCSSWKIIFFSFCCVS